MGNTIMRRRGFLGNLLGAAVVAAAVPAVAHAPTLAERRKKAQDELLAVMREQFPDKSYGIVNQFDDLFMIKMHV